MTIKTIMSCSDYCLSDLLCCDESPDSLSDYSQECSSVADFPPYFCSHDDDDDDDSIAAMISDERNFVPGKDYVARFQSQSLDAKSRQESVAWILKVQAFYNFQPLTAYLAVNYLDRFLYLSDLPETNGWPMQLLSVACLSLAAKMEELLVPSLLDLQVEGAKYIFEPRTIRKMELLVLSVLNWKLRSITPFSYIHFFASKLDCTRASYGFLISRSTSIILSLIRDTSFHEYSPSCIAAAAMLCAAKEIPNLCLVKPEHAASWCEGLSKEKIVCCYQLMQMSALENSQQKTPKVIPQLRVTVQARVMSSYSYSCSSSSSTSSSSATSYKRRKLNNCLWADYDKEYSE